MRLDSYGEGLGSVSVDTRDRTVTAGSRLYMRVTYHVGEAPIAAGGAIRFRLPGLFAKGGCERAPVECSRDGVQLRAANFLQPVNGKNGQEFFARNDYFFVMVEEGALRAGETVTVTYGDLGTTHNLMPTWAQKWAVEVAVDPDGTRPAPNSGFYLLADPPLIEIVPGRPEALEVTVPSTARCGESVTVMLRARDHHRNVVRGYESAFETRLLSADGARPLDLDFELNREGVLAYRDLSLREAGVHRLEVVDRELDFRAVSNAVRATVEEPPVRLYWGDTHCHSCASGDTSSISEFITPGAGYRYARDVAHLDFCAVTDHSEDLHVAPEDWDMVRRAAAEAYEPGRFVTFSAYEATHRPQRRDGDKNVYFLDDDRSCVTEGNTEETYAALKRQTGDRVMVIPHLHVPTNWEKHDPELEYVVEVYSHWGCGFSPESRPRIVPGRERPPESCVTHALERGIRLGFIASADHSCGHPGDDFWWRFSSFQGGLAAVYAEELTREGIWNALRARHCYATTRARILLRFSVNGRPMGSEISLPPEEPRQLFLEVNGTCAIEELRIMRSSELLHAAPGRGRRDVELEIEDAGTERETDYYYVHVTQRDGEQAWASGVWVSRVQ